ncbi:G1/S-specific cyclin-D1-like [Dysidea avara]|uniref:G1/S-specific cyclin-D1-like n=1 Tax=Dysidea avara TaxID=196820 RepID=UPI0033283015
MVRQHARNLSSFAVSEYNLVGQPSSLVACGAICCAVDSLQPELTQECLKTLTNLTGIEQEPLLQCQHNINGCFEQRLYELEQYHAVQHKEEEPDVYTPTEIGDLFFQNIQKNHLPVQGGREH